MKTLAVGAVALVAVACGGSSSTAPEPADPGAAEARVAPSGRDSITAGELRAHVERLASDEYRGRETLEDGYRLAADYLAAAFRSYGLAPMPGQSDYAVAYTLYELGYDDKGTALAVGGAAYRPGVDFTPFPFSDEGAAEGAVVFAGYGITAPDQGWDDYEGLDARGKIVLVLRHHPGEDAGESKLQAHSLFAAKADNARTHGAVGMLLVTDPLHHGEGDDLRMRGMLLTQPLDDETRARLRGDGKPAEAPFLAMHVSQLTAEALVATAGKPLVELQKAVDAGAKPATFKLAGANAALSVAAAGEEKTVTPVDVAGFLPGSDPALRDQWVVVGAHFDHLGGYDGSGDTIYNGADDNASGTAGMLELAQAFAARPDRPRRSILFIGFSGEEKGLLGSRALIDQKILPIEKVVFMLNLDMIGRNPDRPVDVSGDGYSDGIKAAVEAANADVALPIAFGGDGYAGNSDHHPFYAGDVPFLFFFTGLHDDYHQLSDHADKLAYDRMQQIARVAYGTVDGVASGQVTPSFVHHITWLGARIQVRDGDAVITGMAKNSRGDEAGLVAGDVIRHFGDRPLADARQVGAQFRAWEPGTALSLGIERRGEKRSILIERAKPGYLGVFPGAVGEDQRKALGLTDDEGILINELSSDGPAGKAGLQKGDILIRIHGLPVSPRSLGTHLARIGAGETVKIVVIRGGERLALDLVLGERPERARRRP